MLKPRNGARNAMRDSLREKGRRPKRFIQAAINTEALLPIRPNKILLD
jgi:hypothetical protein